jgi:hypothetical protein
MNAKSSTSNFGWTTTSNKLNHSNYPNITLDSPTTQNKKKKKQKKCATQTFLKSSEYV